MGDAGLTSRPTLDFVDISMVASVRCSDAHDSLMDLVMLFFCKFHLSSRLGLHLLPQRYQASMRQLLMIYTRIIALQGSLFLTQCMGFSMPRIWQLVSFRFYETSSA